MRPTAKSDPKKGTWVVHNKKGDEVVVVRDEGSKKAVVHDREGKLVKQPAAAKAAPLAYDLESIEESNRIGSALCRQNAS